MIMIKCVRLRAVLALFLGCAAAVSLHAQNLPATPHTPDLLGLYPGMSLAEAQATLQKRSTTAYVRRDSSDATLSLTVSDANGTDVISAFMTQPPNDPYVWMIRRQWDPRGGGAGMSSDALLSGLRQKYGHETLTSDHAGGGYYAFWLFDQSGKLLATADPALANCDGLKLQGYVRTGPDAQPNDIEKACFGGFFGVEAFFHGGKNAPMLIGYTVTLMNLPYGYRASVITQNAKTGPAKQAAQDQQNRANQNKPTF